MEKRITKVNLKRKEVEMMKRIVFLTSMLIAVLVFAGVSSAIVINSGPFGAKYLDVSFADYDFAEISNLPLHPLQNPANISEHVWGIVSLTTIHTLTDNNPENNALSGVNYYTQGSDGKYYFGVYGGLERASGTLPGQQRLVDAGFATGAYMKIYETTSSTLYDLAVAAGPNVAGAGAFGTFGLKVIYGLDGAPGGGDDPVLWLDTVFSLKTLNFYDQNTDGGELANELELITSSSSVTGSAEGYLDILGGTGAVLFQKGVFDLSNFLTGTDRADLKVISNLTADIGPTGWRGLWTNSSQDPITGVGVPEPSTIILLGSGLLGLAAVGRNRFRK